MAVREAQRVREDDARSRFPEIVWRVNTNHKPVIITHSGTGQPRAVLISIEDYERLADAEALQSTASVEAVTSVPLTGDTPRRKRRKDSVR